jgi:hypothetical protein
MPEPETRPDRPRMNPQWWEEYLKARVESGLYAEPVSSEFESTRQPSPRPSRREPLPRVPLQEDLVAASQNPPSARYVQLLGECSRPEEQGTIVARAERELHPLDYIQVLVQLVGPDESASSRDLLSKIHAEPIQKQRVRSSSSLNRSVRIWRKYVALRSISIHQSSLSHLANRLLARPLLGKGLERQQGFSLVALCPGSVQGLLFVSHAMQLTREVRSTCYERTPCCPQTAETAARHIPQAPLSARSYPRISSSEPARACHMQNRCAEERGSQ